jgi:hypothetical protein
VNVSERKKLARKVTEVLLELREECQSSYDYLALVEPLIYLIDEVINRGGSRRDVMERLERKGTFK